MSDFDPAKDAVAFDDLLEIDRYALSRAAELQTEIRAHFDAYEFHPVVSKLQLYCSEDLGAFYLDVLKDRLYTTAPKSLARRSAQTALHQITHAMLRWMAPFLSFTAEEAWTTFGSSKTIFLETFTDLGHVDAALMARWAIVQQVRDLANKEIENQRTAGVVGASLQAELNVQCEGETHAALAALGEDLKFVFITSQVRLVQGPGLSVTVQASAAHKCDRCWHYSEDVGQHAEHPTICGRCVSNLNEAAGTGAGETRKAA